MYSRVEIKERAKEQIRGNIGILLLIQIIFGLLLCASSLVIIGSLLIMGPMTLGLALVYLDVSYGVPLTVNRMFEGFDQFGKAFVLNLLIGIFTFLWSLLFFIPGIIKEISYSMAFYILAENPGMSAVEALNESKRIMNGHKMDYFILQLSFIGWSLLGAITFGLAYIYVIPYMTASQMNFYHAIKGDRVDAF